jgi:DNA-directed RNA polymerase subunit alpha
METIKIKPYMPTELEVEEIGENRISVKAYPFESGNAITFAHPVRRLLLSSSVGYAPIAMKIEGAKHEFDSIRGILEDVAIFIVNLKNIRFNVKSELEEEQEIVLDYEFEGKKEVSSSELSNDLVEVIGIDTHLATIGEGSALKFSIIVKKGLGYVPSEDIRDIIPEDYIALDAYFAPVKKVVYDIEKVLVEDDPNFEKIIFDITTDGRIEPVEAFKNAISVMKSQMDVFNRFLNIEDVPTIIEKEETIDLKPFLVGIDELNLSARSFNNLDKAGVKYFGELVLLSEASIKNIKNLGAKSCTEILSKISEKGYSAGEDLDKELKNALVAKIEELKS